MGWAFGLGSGERRWMIKTDPEDAQALSAIGPHPLPGERVEVMPVAEHEEYGRQVMPVLLEVENLGMEAAAWRCALEEIRDQDPVENALDPQWAARIAAQALAHLPLSPNSRRPGSDPFRRRWTLWVGDDEELRADAIRPAWGGGGYVVVPEDPTVTPPWEDSVEAEESPE